VLECTDGSCITTPIVGFFFFFFCFFLFFLLGLNFFF
jgi:hypothetical protein